MNTDLWGVDEDGEFLSSPPSFWQRWWQTLRKKWSRAVAPQTPTERSVKTIVFQDLVAVQSTFHKELVRLRSPLITPSKIEKNKRLLFLFQKDLLPGIAGQILEAKDSRDREDVPGVSRSAKILAWTFLIAMNASMLFYIFLFAVSQDSYRQSAWAQSFALWLVAEICFISTSMVILMHVLIPTLTMRDVKQIKRKLLDSLLQYRRLMASGEAANSSAVAEDKTQFNAAQYLFVSCQLAKALPQLKAAQVIAKYSTVWPRQSYQHEVNMAKTYDRKFTALSRSASIVVLFFVTNLLSVPLTIQDMVMQLVTTTVTGYTVLVHLQLFAIFPVLVVVPTLFVAVLIHFFVSSRRKKREEELQALLKVEDSKGKEKGDVEKTVGEQKDSQESKRGDSRHEEKKSDDQADDESDDDSFRSDLEDFMGEMLAFNRAPAAEQLVSASSEAEEEGYVVPKQVTAVPSRPPNVPAHHTTRRQSLRDGLVLLKEARQFLVPIAGEEEEEGASSEHSEEKDDIEERDEVEEELMDGGEEGDDEDEAEGEDEDEDEDVVPLHRGPAGFTVEADYDGEDSEDLGAIRTREHLRAQRDEEESDDDEVDIDFMDKWSLPPLEEEEEDSDEDAAAEAFVDDLHVR